MSEYDFKIARTEEELEQIHRLNARTFTREIPQHEPPEDGRLVDRFHDENTYVIARTGSDGVVGMISINDQRPYSLDEKLDDLDSFLPPHESACEFRLLSVEQPYRKSRVFYGLLKRSMTFCFNQQHDLGLISGHLDRVRLYQKLGFEPFGPVVGSDGARFQPMYLTRASFLDHYREQFGREPDVDPRNPLSLMPGPVETAPEVERAYREPAVSHRSDSMYASVRQVKDMLTQIAGAQHVELLTGSGTLANEAVAAQLSQISGSGLILTNGEFGERILDQANQWNLDVHVFEGPEHRAYSPESIRSRMEETSDLSWVWMVHTETSTGVLNPLSGVQRLCEERNLHLCVDCISSLGAVPIDLSGVFMATGVSGKALAARAGLSFVFHNGHLPETNGRLPRYLDLSFYAENNGIPFTLSSNQVDGLRRALTRFEGERRYEHIRDLSMTLRDRLTEMGYRVVADRDSSSPAVITIDLPDHLDAERIGDDLKSRGVLLSYRSGYLVDENRLQICLMGELDRDDVLQVLPMLEDHAERL